MRVAVSVPVIIKFNVAGLGRFPKDIEQAYKKVCAALATVQEKLTASAAEEEVKIEFENDGGTIVEGPYDLTGDYFRADAVAPEET